ncbi:MAG: CCA tRNA nucleotidyltransferase [Verrucomicrobiales bacterium]
MKSIPDFLKESPLGQAGLVVLSRLREAGHQALLAGGCVRDLLLGIVPKDLDVATSAKPEVVQRLFPKNRAVGAHFGVILVREQERDFEVATFRTEGSYQDGRRPESVQFSTAEEDAQRRDFTINGLFFDPFGEQILDFVGGQADLDAGLLRAIGKAWERFQEDRLRLLRCIRFAARLNFRIEEATWTALKREAPGIEEISVERIREELNAILLAPSRVQGFDLLDDSSLLSLILPEVAALKGCEQPPEFHPEGDVFVHTRLMLSLLAEDVPLEVVWAVLLHDIGKVPTRVVDETGRARFNAHEKVGARMAEKVLGRLRFSTHQTQRIVEAVEQHMAFKDVQQMRAAKLRRFMARPGFDDELELHRVDCTSSHGMLDNHEFLLAKQEEFANEPIIPEPLITGRDLIEAGWSPGPRFKEVLEAVQTAQLEGNLSSREEALEWVAQNYGL